MDDWDSLKDDITALLAGKKPSQVTAYIDANVTDLASAKAFLKKLTLVVLFMLNNNSFVLGE